jgi:carboxypeptidase Q
MYRTSSRLPWWVLIVVVSAATVALIPRAQATQPDDLAAKAKALDQKIIVDAKKGSELITNLTYLSDIIGPRLTGSAALKKANDWAADKMKSYGLVNVHHEVWLMPEGWERGSASGRLLEPDNGRSLSLASMGWTPGTNGKIQGDVIVFTATKSADLAAFKDKLRGAIILDGAPRKLTPIADIEKGGLFTAPELPKKEGQPPSFEEMRAFAKDKATFFQQEGVAAVLVDAGKHHGLLFTSGGWFGTERPSAVKKLPTLAVAHEHYAMLHRLAMRPAPAKTRIELEASNKFIPGPIKVHNTVGEIRGSEKPDEFVVVGAHLDSWDLGTGTVDNGTGSCIVLETARVLAKCPAPKRTIRFVLFTGEEQGLHGSKAYVDEHKDELPRISACLVHDTGTGKVLSLGWLGNREPLNKMLETELTSLKDLGVTDVCARGFGGSDHASFSRAGVPGMAFNQEIAGYRFGHHSQADTMELVREGDLLQGVQVMAVSTMRLANAEQLLPRTKK